MKLWEIKAQALRLMFADTDMMFDYTEFENRAVYENVNTREKLVRMEDSIRRAIDLFYEYVGQSQTFASYVLDKSEEGAWQNEITLAADVGSPTRVDAVVNDGRLTHVHNAINFLYDSFDRKIKFEENYVPFAERLSFNVWYKRAKLNLPPFVDELTYDLNELRIPESAQRMIPYFIKGELYEEDEPNIAAVSKQQYVDFLMTMERPFIRVQTKVKRSKIFEG